MERSSYQSKVAPKGVSHLSSIPHAAHTAHLAREEADHGDSPEVGVDDLSAQNTLAQRQDGCRGRCRMAGAR